MHKHFARDATCQAKLLSRKGRRNLEEPVAGRRWIWQELFVCVCSYNNSDRNLQTGPDTETPYYGNVAIASRNDPARVINL